ncbi:Zinc finger protein 37 [Portunus trituberculatus]|uniref:Zinc finger protein 37 n=1 Tax=Portunus trituberculatus TaxID=210409 RepID=A0A5B7CQY6_PORTR|nr:Zinc finger protein 37 [Portunus trituberculatus]
MYYFKMLEPAWCEAGLKCVSAGSHCQPVFLFPGTILACLLEPDQVRVQWAAALPATNHPGQLPRASCRIGCNVSRLNTTMSAMQQQQLSASGLRILECQEYGKKFKTEVEVTIHILRHSDVNDVKNYECEECDIKFITKFEFTIHNLPYSSVKNYEYQECGKRLKSRGEVTIHTLTLSDVRDHKYHEWQEIYLKG